MFVYKAVTTEAASSAPPRIMAGDEASRGGRRSDEVILTVGMDETHASLGCRCVLQ